MPRPADPAVSKLEVSTGERNLRHMAGDAIVVAHGTSSPGRSEGVVFFGPA